MNRKHILFFFILKNVINMFVICIGSVLALTKSNWHIEKSLISHHRLKIGRYYKNTQMEENQL